MLRLLLHPIKTWQRRNKKDRIVLVKTLFKAIAHQTDYLANGKKVLWIGVCPTTKGYYKKLEAQGACVWTVDVDPAVAKFGNGTRHAIGDATALAAVYESGFFDAVFCNGVIGWGIDSEADQARCYASMAQVLKPNGLLVLGWNTHKSRDPLVSQHHAPHFEPYDLPGFGARMVVQQVTHVFDIWSRR